MGEYNDFYDYYDSYDSYDEAEPVFADSGSFEPYVHPWARERQERGFLDAYYDEDLDLLRFESMQDDFDAQCKLEEKKQEERLIEFELLAMSLEPVRVRIPCRLGSRPRRGKICW